MRRTTAAAGLALCLGAVACTQEVERIPQVYQPTNAHEAYLHGLVEANLEGSAMARDWIEASRQSLRDPVAITSPFRESGYFDAGSAGAVGYLFSVSEGQRVDAALSLDAREPIRVFMDLFRLVDDDPQAPIHVASGAVPVEPPVDSAAPAAAPESMHRLHIEPLRDGTYILRVQPELLRSASYTLVLTADASLAFPVSGHTARSIQSVFGADRDAGRRSHRGVDIFAPRGTPVVAASAGIVTRANTTEVGGNVVWVNDSKRNLRLYYAHLDSHTVARGTRVEIGDQLGTVGNTGNARTTPPHLHFGVYARGATDPYPYLQRARTDPEDLSVDVDRLGAWARAIADNVQILAAPQRTAPVIGSVDRFTPLFVAGASARWYRVELPDGARGYVLGTSTELATPMRSEAVTESVRLLDRPETRGTLIEQLGPGTEVPVLGAYGDFLYVQAPTGLNGWLSFE